MILPMYLEVKGKQKSGRYYYRTAIKQFLEIELNILQHNSNQWDQGHYR